MTLEWEGGPGWGGVEMTGEDAEVRQRGGRNRKWQEVAWDQV